jgi:hypothetical protein
MNFIDKTQSQNVIQSVHKTESSVISSQEGGQSLYQAVARNIPVSNLYISPQLFLKDGYISLEGHIIHNDSEKVMLQMKEGVLVFEKMSSFFKNETSRYFIYVPKGQYQDLRQALSLEKVSYQENLEHKWSSLKQLFDGSFRHKISALLPHVNETWALKFFHLVHSARNSKSPQEFWSKVGGKVYEQQLSPQQRNLFFEALSPLSYQGFSTQFCLYENLNGQLSIASLYYHLGDPLHPDKKHFEFVLHNTPFGMIVIEGLVKSEWIYFTVKSEKVFHSTDQTAMQDIVKQVLSGYNLKGDLRFAPFAKAYDLPRFSPLNIHL